MFYFLGLECSELRVWSRKERGLRTTRVIPWPICRLEGIVIRIYQLFQPVIHKGALKSALTLWRQLSLSYTVALHSPRSAGGEGGCAGGDGAEVGKGAGGGCSLKPGPDLSLRFSHLVQLQAQKRKAGMKLKIQIIRLVSCLFSTQSPGSPKAFPSLPRPSQVPALRPKVWTLGKKVNT